MSNIGSHRKAPSAPKLHKRLGLGKLLGARLLVGRYFGIPLYLHWSFFLLPLFVGYQQYQTHHDKAAALVAVSMVLLCFSCVVLHEFGHALAARAFGIGTRDITMMPIGGVARLERMPRDPWQEIIVAIAGPAVNVVIALTFACCLYGIHGQSFGIPELGYEDDTWFSAQFVMLVNIGLIVFNMIPAFPMDGGRVFRALLALKTDYRNATLIAMRVGQVLAIGIGIAGYMSNSPLTPFLAAFVFVVGTMEFRQVDMSEKVRGATVGQAMITRVRVVAHHCPVPELLRIAADNLQRDFPVVDNDRYIGMLRGSDIGRAARESPSAIAAQLIGPNAIVLEKDDELEDIFLSIDRGENLLPVVSQSGDIVGLLDPKSCIHRLGMRRQLIEAGISLDADEPQQNQHSGDNKDMSDKTLV